MGRDTLELNLTGGSMNPVKGKTITLEPLRKCKDCGLEAHTQDDLNLFAGARGSRFDKMNICQQCVKVRKNLIRKHKSKKPIDLICECCNNKVEHKLLCFDHCHSTGKHRGWICNKCNTGIGSLGDNIEGVQNALNYLERHYNDQDT